MKEYGTWAIAVVLVAGFFVVGSQEQSPLGASAGPDMSNRTAFNAAYYSGGVFSVATTGATHTLTDREIANVSVISIPSSAAGPALTLTTPASTTWTSLPKNGDVQTWVIDNLHTAAATTTTITAGTGVDIDGTTANDDVINGGVSGTLTCWRLPNTDVRCIVEEMVDAG